MWVAVVVVVIILAAVVFNSGQKQFDKSRPILGVRYSELCSILMQGHSESQVWTDHDNRLIVGVKNFGGHTLFHISETPDEKVEIKYECSNNPAFRDFELPFQFSKEYCTSRPDLVYEKINESIGKYLQENIESLTRREI